MNIDLFGKLPRRPALALGLALALAALAAACWLNLVWAELDQHPLPPELDCFKYVINSHLIAHQALTAPDGFSAAGLIRAWRDHPLRVWNAFVLLPAWLTATHGPDRPAEVQALLPFLLLLFAATVALGWLTMGPAEGLLAGLVLLAFPGTLGFSRMLHLEVPAMCLAAGLPLLAWRLSQGFRPLSAAALGLLLVLGAFVRYEFIVYAAPALLCGLVALAWRLKAAPRRGRELRRSLANALPCLALLIGGAALYWLLLPEESARILTGGLAEGPFAPEYIVPPALERFPWLVLPLELARVTVEPWWAAAALLGALSIALLPERRRRGAAFVLLYVLLGLAFLSAWPNLESRRLLLILPALAVLIALGAVELRRRLGDRRGAALCLLACVALAWGYVRAYRLSFDPQAALARNFLLERNVPRPPRDQDSAALEITCALLRHATWPAESAAAIMGKVNVEPASVMLLAAYRGLLIVPIYSYEEVGIERNPLFNRLGPPFELILALDEQPCGPNARVEDFGYAAPLKLDRLCATLPRYRPVDAVVDAGGRTTYVLGLDP